MKTMLKIGFIVAVLVTISNSLMAQEKDYMAELMKDLVEIKNDKYIMEQYSLLKNPGSDDIQMKYTSSAPISIISRDNFVAVSTILLDQVTSDYSKNEELDELIGDPDMIVNLVMAKNGIQIQLTLNGSTKRMTMTWKEVYSE